jgi:hypothetical protein
MKKIRELLLQGDAAGAVQRLAQAAQARPDQAEPLADAMRDLLKELYAGYVVRPVHDCVQQLEAILSPEALEAIIGELRPSMDRTRHWYAELRLLRTERLLRELRSAVSLNDLDLAHVLARTYLQEARNDQEKNQLARQLINALAGLVRDQKRSAQVVQALMADASAGPFDGNLMQLFTEAAQREARGGLKENEREWTQALNGATVALMEYVPGKNAVGEPTDEEMGRFCSEMEAMLRAGLGRGRSEDLVDALRLVMEFSPTDPSSLSSLVGVEPRAFLSIGPRAKLTSVRGLDRIGENPGLRARVLELAKSEAGRRRVTTLAAAMGGLRNADFYPFLDEALSKAGERTREEEIIIDSIGRIGVPAGVERILALLRDLMTKREAGKLKVLDQKDVKRARMLLTALSRIARSRDMPPPDRNSLIRRVIECVGDRDSEINYTAAELLFSLRMNELERPLKAWAVQQITRSIFAKDRGGSLLSASASPLGFRQPMVAALVRLGQEMLPEILEAAAPGASTFSGGLQAMGEVLEKIGDERAVPLLEAMSRTALAHDDSKVKDSILAEKVGDAASGQARPLTRDDVLHSLLFALGEGRR